jgi:uncharacterized membrane protein YcaP (DUF421 family)
MPTWLNLDWHRMFLPSQPILETVIRGTATYLSLFVLLRLFRRQVGSLGPADLLVLLLIADASQNAMAGEYRAITDGLILVATIVGWEYALDYLSFHVPAIGRLIDRQPLPVVEHGAVNRANLRRELMSEEELLSQIRQKGVDDVALIRRSFIEGDGHVSVITNEQAGPHQSVNKQSAVV